MISESTQREFSQALREGNLARAGEIAEHAIVRGETHETLFSLAGHRRQQMGDSRGAVALYLRAVELAPHNPAILSVAADALRYTGQLAEAIHLFDRALERDPAAVAAWYGRALALEALGALDEARRSFERVTKLAPDTASGFAGLASLQAQMGQTGAARRNAAKALELGPADGATLLALARCAYAERKDEDAARTLVQLIERPGLPPEVEIAACELLGNVRDRQGMIEAAHAAYSHANARFAQAHGGTSGESVALGGIEDLARGLAALPPGALAAPAAGEGPGAKGHVFVLGYPRSGTTLTEQILATIPDTVTLEESRTFAAAERYLSSDGLQEFAALDEAAIEALRKDYWSRVAASGIDVAGKTFVDMDPLKGAALPLIARLFPDARIVVVRRDPRDIVWSCFRHSFVYSAVTLEFTSIERTARHYAAVMQLVDTCLSTLPIRAHILRYEELVRDFDTQTKALSAFLGLGWSPDMRAFAKSARKRTVRTASGPQVRGPLFDGSGQWQKYGQYLEPVLPLLAPWIEVPPAG